jgi:hypothetical protein
VNRYGAEALRYWRVYLPASYGKVEDPEEFFTELGEQDDVEIEDRYLEYAGRNSIDGRNLSGRAR